jgi:hypothetical protein
MLAQSGAHFLALNGARSMTDFHSRLSSFCHLVCLRTFALALPAIVLTLALAGCGSPPPAEPKSSPPVPKLPQ